MSTPITVDLPHKLGAEEAKRRIGSGVGRLESHLPAGAQVRSAWSGDRLGLHVAAMGQEMDAQLDVRETFVRIEVMLPPALAFFGKAVEAALRRAGGELLEDKSKGAAR
jgi:Putative polyhydroxyalkanoic acid system protein (PHA_gran_rgn)